jgi:hypothetical protein
MCLSQLMWGAIKLELTILHALTPISIEVFTPGEGARLNTKIICITKNIQL